MHKRTPSDFKRRRILDENLMKYKDVVKMSERNITIVQEYVSGISVTQLAKMYEISRERVSYIIQTYILYCMREQKG